MSPSSARPVTVYPLPPVLETNPYLDRLYAPMSREHVNVRRGRPRYELPRLLLGRGPRVLHLHFFDELTQRPSVLATAMGSLGMLALLALLKLRGVRLVWTAHNLAPHERYHAGWSFLLYRSVARMSDAVIAHSEAARELLCARYGPICRVHVVPHGEYIGAYGPAEEREASRAALGLPLGAPVLLAIGALRPYKNIEGLIEAFAMLPEGARGTLLIAGKPKTASYAEALAAHAVHVPGTRLQSQFIPDADIPRFLAAADAVVLPYRELLTSGALLWALSYGRPVVAPAFGPVRELVREGIEGFLFAPGSTESLSEALRRAIEHAGDAGMEAAALRRARSFDWPGIARRTAEIYMSLTGAV